MNRKGGGEWDSPTSNVAKLPILKQQEMLPSRNLLQAFDCFFGPVVYDVGMGL